MDQLRNVLFVACFLVLRFSKVSSLSYLDSLSISQANPASTELATMTYLDSLQQHSSTMIDATTTHGDWATTIMETPDEHYAKDHPGAGWAGYKDPMYGGYLDNLSSGDDPTNKCVFEIGKKADYGDDIRWGAQVYLDNLN